VIKASGRTRTAGPARVPERRPAPLEERTTSSQKAVDAKQQRDDA